MKIVAMITMAIKINTVTSSFYCKLFLSVVITMGTRITRAIVSTILMLNSSIARIIVVVVLVAGITRLHHVTTVDICALAKHVTSYKSSERERYIYIYVLKVARKKSFRVYYIVV